MVGINLIILFSCLSVIIFSIIPLYENHLLEKHQQFSSTMVLQALSVVERQYDSIAQDGISEIDAKQRAIKQLKAMYSKNDYFWVHDMNLIMVAHPFSPELERTNLAAYTDTEGIHVFKKMNDLVRLSGQGFITYKWAKPSEKQAQPKMSFVKLFAPWEWVIGSGTYIDDVKAETLELEIRVGVLCLVLLGLIVAFSIYAARRINKPLKDAVKLTSNIVEHGSETDYGAGTAYEPDILLNAISQMVTQLKENEVRYKNLIESTHNWIWEIDASYVFTYVSPQVKDLLGYEPEDILGKRPFDFMTTEEAVRVNSFFTEISSKMESFQHFEMTKLHKDGRSVLLDINGIPFYDSQDNFAGYRGTAINITEKKQAENRREVNKEVLQLLCESNDFKESIAHIIALLKLKIGFDAIAIRIKIGDDYPFMSEVGFPKELLCKENSLRGNSVENEVRHNTDKNKCLECTCGLVITGNNGPWQPFVTSGGSFWTNDSFQLLHLTADQDPRNNPRNECIHHGFASMALVPIRYKDEVVGLMQCYNRCKNKLTKDSVLHLEGVAAYISGALMRKWSEEENVDLENKLHQAQKMELVGRLAGGVAHDFNNMLCIITGYAALGLSETDSGDPLNSYLHEISKAADRSANFTRQLLAFARKQTIAPRVIELNDIIANMLKMLQRVIGEDVNLYWQPGTTIWPLKMDPSQVDQIMVNLCVNARDSIKNGGKIFIETGNTTIDETYRAFHPEAVCGDFVWLSVTDNGRGMDKETQTKIFEPFFTTKGVGEGTGLGLATVYGIIKQNNGFIYVYSELNQGTTLKIYFPRHFGENKTIHTPETTPHIPYGLETILIVEDEPAILEIASMLLKKQGYKVLSANSPEEALILAREYADEIHLLMTDVVMPEMNGRELATRLTKIYPGIKCLFMSGYTANIIAHYGVIDEGINFIQKPFPLPIVASKVREILDSV